MKFNFCTCGTFGEFYLTLKPKKLEKISSSFVNILLKSGCMQKIDLH